MTKGKKKREKREKKKNRKKQKREKLIYIYIQLRCLDIKLSMK